MSGIIRFFTGFIARYFTTAVLEKIVIILLKTLVKRTNSKVDDELFEAVFEKTKENNNE